MKDIKQNIFNSIVLIGPCGVGKSLIASHLSEKTNIPFIDIDDLMFMIELDMEKILSPNPKTQKKFFQDRLKESKQLQREVPLTDYELKKEKEMIVEFINLYNYYHNLLGGLKQFHGIYREYYKSTNNIPIGFEDIYKFNRVTYKLLDKIYKSTNTNFIISPPGGFGWVEENIQKKETCLLQDKVNKFLNATHTILLCPGQDYILRNPTDEKSINELYLLRNYQNYYKNATLEISTNGLFYNPENDFLKQRTWINVREALTKEKLKNSSEINNICDQILEFYNNSFVENEKN